MNIDARRVRKNGFTLVELLIVLAIIATLSALAIPRYRTTLQSARISVAIEDIKDIHLAIEFFDLMWGRLPINLSELGSSPLLDPWGEPYYYLNFSTTTGKGEPRKDKFLVPLNTTYDLYSSGPDRATAAPLTAEQSHDDIIRANDGEFIGIASAY